MVSFCVLYTKLYKTIPFLLHIQTEFTILCLYVLKKRYYWYIIEVWKYPSQAKRDRMFGMIFLP